MTHNGRHNADEVLALALATGQTLRGAAAAAGVAERTAARRWADAGFRARVTELRTELIGRAVGRLADAAATAADALVNLLAGRSEAARLGAARSILELGARLREGTELAERVAELERAQREGTKHELASEGQPSRTGSPAPDAGGRTGPAAGSGE